jgi:mono/diheme cytochrome c family protein
LSKTRLLELGVIFVVLLFGLIQLVPYGRDHTNPPVQGEPAWDSPQTRQLVAQACFDCHSHETNWPWYSHVAPVSWLIQHDVKEGRSAVNFSAWGLRGHRGGELTEVVREGEMPPWYYALLHSSSRLSADEKDALIRGLNATFGQP